MNRDENVSDPPADFEGPCGFQLFRHDRRAPRFPYTTSTSPKRTDPPPPTIAIFCTKTIPNSHQRFPELSEKGMLFHRNTQCRLSLKYAGQSNGTSDACHANGVMQNSYYAITAARMQAVRRQFVVSFIAPRICDFRGPKRS